MPSTLNFIFEEIQYQAYCTHYQLLTGRKNSSLAKILVDGTYKTGTTWMVRLLASIPGYTWQRDFGKDFRMLDQVQPGEVLHAHFPYSLQLEESLITNHVHTIICIRDPRDQITSNLYHIRRDVSNAWHEDFMAMSEADCLMALIEGRPGYDGKPGLGSVNQVFRISLSWQAAKRPVLFIRYEDLIQDTPGQLQKALEYSGIRCSPKLVRLTVERNRFERMSVGRKIWQPPRKSGEEDTGSHFRKGIVGDWKNHFNPEHKHRFKELSGDLLIQLGYEKDLDW